MLSPGERRLSWKAKEKLFAEISNLIAEPDAEEEESNPSDVTADRLVSQVCSLHAAFEDPASTSRPTSGFNGATFDRRRRGVR